MIMKYIKCFDNLIGIHILDTNIVQIIARIGEHGILQPMKPYGKGFPIDYVKRMGSVTNYEI